MKRQTTECCTNIYFINNIIHITVFLGFISFFFMSVIGKSLFPSIYYFLFIHTNLNKKGNSTKEWFNFNVLNQIINLQRCLRRACPHVRSIDDKSRKRRAQRSKFILASSRNSVVTHAVFRQTLSCSKIGSCKVVKYVWHYKGF